MSRELTGNELAIIYNFETHDLELLVPENITENENDEVPYMAVLMSAIANAIVEENNEHIKNIFNDFIEKHEIEKENKKEE
jgi:hypothetical protein